MDLSSNHLNDLLYLTINQDQTCFVVGTEEGFRVYSTDPFKPAFSRRFRDIPHLQQEGAEEPVSGDSSTSRRAQVAAASGGVGIVEMLYRCNILALVGGGRNPRFAPHKVILWHRSQLWSFLRHCSEVACRIISEKEKFGLHFKTDDRHPRPLAELSFRTTVRAVRLRRDMIVVAIDAKVYVYRFSDLTLVDSLATAHNPRGIIALSQGDDRAVLATVANQQKGRVRVSVYETPLPAESRGPSTSSVILAHDSSISQLALNASGTLLATASDKGTLIRIHDTETGYLLQELRRGVDRADICSIVFHSTSRWIVVSSDKGTVHVFAVRPSSAGGRDSRGSGGNARSKFRFFGGYFGSEWSFAQFRVPDYRCIACFGSTANTVIIMCADGSYYKAKFDPVFGGEMVRIDTGRFDGASERHRMVGDHLQAATSSTHLT